MSLRNIIIGVGYGCGIMVLVYFTWAAIIWQGNNARAQTLAQIQTALVLTRQRVYQKQNAGIFGGETPAATIYLYYEFLESRDFILLSTYFVPDKRKAELSRFNDVTDNAILQFVKKLKAAEETAKKDNPSKSPYIINSPIKMEMQKMDNGVWEFVYINYDLKNTK